MIIVDASRIIHQLQFDIRSDKMYYKFFSLLIVVSTLFIFTFELNVNGVSTKALTIPQADCVQGYNVRMKLLGPEDPSKTTELHGRAKCDLMKKNKPDYKVYPRFSIKTQDDRQDLTEKWYIPDDSPLEFYNCSTVKNNYQFYRITAIYVGKIIVGTIIYPDDEAVRVKEKEVSHDHRPQGGGTAQISITYYRSYDNEAKNQVQLDRGAKVYLYTGTILNKIWNALT